MTRNTSNRFGTILCDDEIEDEILTKLKDWVLEYQAEVERQRGWAARTLTAPASIIPVALFERQPEDAVPCITVNVERVSASRMPQSGEAGMDWRLVVEVLAAGADDEDVRRRLRGHVAAVRTLLLQQGGAGPVVTMIRLTGTEYSPTGERAGRTMGVGVMEFLIGTQDASTRWRGGKTTPAVDPYAIPAPFVPVVSTNPTVGGTP